LASFAAAEAKIAARISQSLSAFSNDDDRFGGEAVGELCRRSGLENGLTKTMGDFFSATSNTSIDDDDEFSSSSTSAERA
jgi:hypothetical protein